MGNHHIDCAFCGQDTRGLSGVRGCYSREEANRCGNYEKPSVPATPAQPAGAVPDSLREAFEAAELHECWVNGDTADVMTNPYGHCGNFDQIVARCATGDLWRKRAVAIAESLNFVRTLLASHPSGQSAGSGAEGVLASLSPAMSPEDHASSLRSAASRAMAEGASKRSDRLLSKAEEIEAAIASKPVPDSTRTGQGEALRSAMIRALDGHTAHSRDCHMSGDYLCQQVWPLVEAALAASQAAPEAQGAEAPGNVMARISIDVRDDGTEGTRFTFKRGLKFADGEVAIARAIKALNVEFDSGARCPAAKQARGPWSFDMEAAPRDATTLDLWCYGRRHIDYRWDTEGRFGGWWSDTKHKDRHWRDRECLMPDSVTAWRLSDAPPASSGQGGR